jgi:hypothetical protein
MVSRADYEYWLGAAEVVISTAIHEFQGLSVHEAVSAGAVPVVPDDLCYREQYPEALRYPPADTDAAVAVIRAVFSGKDGCLPQAAVTSSADAWRQWLNHC